MGQHKTNSTAILAKQGKISPKPKGPTKAEQDRELRALLVSTLASKFTGDPFKDEK